MIPALLLQFFFGLGGRAEPPFNNPPGVDIWCGKAYRSTNSSFDPGGALTAPHLSSAPLLDLRFYPRKNLYLSTEARGSFVVDAPISYSSGELFTNQTFDPNGQNASLPIPFTRLKVQIQDSITSKILVPWTHIAVNSTGNEFHFGFSGLNQSTVSTIPVRIIAASPDGVQTYQSHSTLTILPPRNDTGSVSRIDQRYGGLEVISSLTHHSWKPIFPYSFYTSYDWIVSTINNASATKNLSTYRALGYNIIHPVPPAPYFNLSDPIFEEFLTICDGLELYIMYDMRHSYQNFSAISTQLATLQHHPSLLLYYTADEPDGWCDPLNATLNAYKHIQSIDPYHPISLVLNCQNFYFGEYTSGADIVLEDTYPLILSTSFSPVYNTPCNSTYGDCGCDNCHYNDPAYPSYVSNKFLDISTRVDDFYKYQSWIGVPSRIKKPIWGVPQAFFDENSFWRGWPTREEEAVMGVLRINHGVKGIVGWIYPTSGEIEGVVGELATVFGRSEVLSLVLGADPVPLDTHGAEGLLDATAWVAEGRMLVSVVHLGYGEYSGKVEVELPDGTGTFRKIKTIWGVGGWGLGSVTVGKSDVKGLEISILLLE